MSDDQFDVIVVGAGPGGYVAAIRAAQLGMNVAIVEKGQLGGVCLNWGCVPTKALIKSAQLMTMIEAASEYGIDVSSASPDLKKMVERSRQIVKKMGGGVDYLLKKNGVTSIAGHATLSSAKRIAVTEAGGKVNDYGAEHIILATGSRPAQLASLACDGKRIIHSSHALSLTELPATMIIVGGGAIGVEFAYFYNSLGTEVTLVEWADTLVPSEDRDISAQLRKSFEKSGINVITNAQVTASNVDGNSVSVTIAIGEPKDEDQRTLHSEMVLSAVGVRSNYEDLGLEDLGVVIEKGKVEVDQFYRTKVEGVYAIGDLVSGPALAHVASEEGVICVENIAGQNVQPLNHNSIPACIYCDPEIASVGLTEQAAQSAGIKVRVGSFPLEASGKAQAVGAVDGFVKVIYDDQYGELLGAHLIGPNVTELIAGIVTAKTAEATVSEILASVHPHPTISEAIKEASADALGRAIHL